ncbi:hypothetical protein Vafri_12059 [Volvox africanus]|nr:hypothetical protein Vafri_12059 [Volvox africanus]
MPEMEGSDHAPAWVDLELPDSELTHGSQLGGAAPSFSSRSFFDTSRQATLHAVLLRRTVASETEPSLAGRASAAAVVAAASGRGDCAGTDETPRDAAATAGMRRSVSCSDTQVLKPGGGAGGGDGGGGFKRRGSTMVSASGSSQTKLTAFMKPRSAGECGPVRFAKASDTHGGDIDHAGGGDVGGGSNVGHGSVSGGDGCGIIVARNVDLIAMEGTGGAGASSYSAEAEAEWQQGSGMKASSAAGDVIPLYEEFMEEPLPYERCRIKVVGLGRLQSEAAAEVRPVTADLARAAASAAAGDAVAMEAVEREAAATPMVVAEAAGRTQAVLAWRQIQHQMKPPRCNGHGEPCVIRTVKKRGDNNGRQFWCCARPDGLPPQGRCEFFQWARERNPLGRAALHESKSGPRLGLGPGPPVVTACSGQGGHHPHQQQWQRQQQQQQGGSEGVQGYQDAGAATAHHGGAPSGEFGRETMRTLPRKRPRL